MYSPLDPNLSLPHLEDELLSYWKTHHIFEKSISSRPETQPWTFLDGPPFITGMPHYGTLLPSILKDIYPRYWTMKGYRVRRVWGWDCHGLPAENKVEAQLGIKRKKDIETKVGIKKFIDACKLYVNEVSGEWEWYIDHIGRWVDFANAYRTMDTAYMESVMWVFKQMYDRGHIYKGMRVSLFCPHCSTPISNFEVAMDPDNYKDFTEPANVYKYKLTDADVYLLAWSTTPWTKLVTPALAVNPNIEYVQVKQADQHYILAASTLGMLVGEYHVEQRFPGKDLIGRHFEPHYQNYSVDPGQPAFVVVGDEFVAEGEGTGVVTLAVYGEEDLKVMHREHLPLPQHLDDEGHVLPSDPQFGGRYYLDINPEVNADLAARGFMYREDHLTHSVPTCWRCHTRLYYAPQDAWYVNVQDLKPRLLETNEAVNWFPPHFKHGRFAKSMQAAPDWCISRSRYWGSPVPVWECSCGWRFIPGSIAELSEAAGRPVTELHKPDIDEVIVTCAKCGQTVHRVPEVLDSWIEAGSASLAERHYPFSGEDLSKFFPPDFIVEYTGQIRAWFYVLHVIAAAIFDTHAFKNVAVTGVIMGTDGKKMSKNLGNYPDPKEVITKYGGDALRLYLGGNPVTRGEDMSISESDYQLQVRSSLLILVNSFNFVLTYANLDQPPYTPSSTSPHVLDRWLVALTTQLTLLVSSALENYDSVTAVDAIKSYITDFSTWYIRRSRDRVGPTATDSSDKQHFYSTVFWALEQFCKTSAPVVPFISEFIYRRLTNSESVHLEYYPSVVPLTPSQTQLLSDMEQVRKVVELGLAQRKAASLKVRQPLRQLEVKGVSLSAELTHLLQAELNVKTVSYVPDSNLSVQLDTTLDAQLIAEGEVRELIRQIQDLRKSQAAKLDQSIKVFVPHPPTGPLLEQLKTHTLAQSVEPADSLRIELI